MNQRPLNGKDLDMGYEPVPLDWTVPTWAVVTFFIGFVAGYVTACLP